MPVPDPSGQGKPIAEISGNERFAAAPPTAARRLVRVGKDGRDCPNIAWTYPNRQHRIVHRTSTDCPLGGSVLDGCVECRVP